MPWKIENGALVVDQSGNPVFVYPDGNEAGINFDNQYAKIAELNSKIVKRQKAIEQKDAVLKLFTDAGLEVTDPTSIGEFLTDAEANRQKIANFNDSDFIKADEVEKLKAREAEKHKATFEKQKLAFDNKIKEKDTVIAERDQALHSAIIRNAILSSDFIRQFTTFPHPEVAYDYLRKHFKVESNGNGDMYGVGIDSDGDTLRSVTEPTKPAGMPEAIELVVKNHPQAKSLLKPDGTGTGAPSTGPRQSSSHSAAGPAVVPADNKSFLDNVDKIAKGEVVRNHGE